MKARLKVGLSIDDFSKEDKECFKNSGVIESSVHRTILLRRMRFGAKFKLIYKASEQGWNFEDFHKACDEVGPTVVLFKSSKGFRFGGFTSLPWKSSGGYKNDKESFIFSLDYREQLFKPNNYTYSIYHKNSWGPNFGSHELGFEGPMPMN